MIFSANINPEKLIVKKHANFVILHMANANGTTEVTSLFDPSHINELHEMLNHLYEIRASNETLPKFENLPKGS